MVGMIPFEKRRATRLYKQTRLGTYDNAKSILLLGSHETFANLVIRCAKEKINFCLVEFELPPVKRRNTFTLFRDGVNKDHNMMPERRLAQLAVRRVPHSFLTNPLEMIDFLDKIKFTPDYIYIATDTEEILDLEFCLNNHYRCVTQYNEHCLNFFKFKSYQQKIYKRSGVLTPEESADFLMVKRDSKSSINRDQIVKFIKRNKDYKTSQSEFSQEYVDIEYILNVDVYIDELGDWYLLRIAKLLCEHSIAYFAIEPFPCTEQLMEEIINLLTPLKQSLPIKKRLNMIQLMRCRKTQRLMVMEFNSRPSAEFSFVRPWERSTYDPLSLLLPEISLPNAFLVDKVRSNDLVWAKYKDKHQDLLNVPIREDLSINLEIVCDTTQEGIIYLHKL